MRTFPPGNALFGVIQAMAQALKVEVTPVNMRDADEIERVLAAFARAPDGGLIVTGSGAAYNYSDLIITLAARHKLPAVYYEHPLFRRRRRPDVIRAGFRRPVARGRLR